MAETVKKTKAPARPRAAAKTKTVREKAAVTTPTREQIAQLAHRFWAERGWRHGSAEQDWFRAEQQLHGMAS